MTLNATADITATDGGYHLRLHLPASDPGFEATELCLSLVHPLDPASLDGARLAERQGDWHRLVLATPWHGERSLTLSFSGNGPMHKLTDQPTGFYLQNGTRRTAITLAGEPDRRAEPARPLPAGTLHWLPRPRQLEEADHRLPCPTALAFAGPDWNTAWLARLWGRLSDVTVPELAEDGLAVREYRDPSLATAFRLHITAAGIELAHRDAAGFQAGQAYLMQYLLQWPLAGELPACTLADTPRFGYRGVHLDVVRHFFAAETIQDWFDLLALFHFNHFHWHLTDDDGWRVASRAYPVLAERAAWRGPDEVLPPQMGSGEQRHGGVYSAEEIRATVERARQLGLTVVPEMDLPGHCRALLKALPELVEAEDASVYRSVQHHDDNVLNPALEATGRVIHTLIDEWCELFEGPLFHLGSDEVPEGAWTGSPAARAWAERSGRPVTDLHGHFMVELERAVQAQGKTAMGWEEIRTGVGEDVSPATWILSWQGVEAGQAAAEAGHPVVMTPAQHCYFDLAVNDRPEDPGYYWAGTVDLAAAWHYDPTAGLSAGAAEHIRGVQACLWSEVIDTPRAAEFMWFPRLLGLAEVAWGANLDGDFGAFEARAGHWMTLLAHLGVAGRARELGW